MRFFLHPAGKAFLVVSLLALVGGLMTFTYYYVKYARLIDQKLREGPFHSTAMIFAAPRVVSLGEQVTAQEIVEQLRRSGYTESRANPLGWYRVREDAVEIFPGSDSYFDREGGVIRLRGGRVHEIISTRDHTQRTQYLLEPELITNLFDKNREKRRLVKFSDVPDVLVQAVISVEDKRFFQHSGFDPLRVIKVAYIDLKERRLEQGASTLSMQLARTLWLDRQKTVRRKAAEVLITLHLEQKLTKEQIFEYYANSIDLGRRGSFAIRGFGEGAQAYFDRDLRELTLAEAATLAGLIQRPSFTNPVRWPDRARGRRNVVLALMRENGYITEEEYAEAAASPLGVARAAGESSDAPYFVDLVNNELQDRFQDHDFQDHSYRVYTTLDLNLQREAVEAVRIGMQEVDEQLSKRRRRDGEELPAPQVALVVLGTRTGAIKALVGGRHYGMSQLNRALAKRQPGSAFKPFVFAAALGTVLEGGPDAMTPLTTILDEPTTFWFDEKPYTPANYRNEYRGLVTLRQALARSMNIPTVKIAERIGYDRVVEVAVRSGMNLRIQPTPAVALGAYEVTPIEVAGAYTVFANEGVHVGPNWINLIRDEEGNILHTNRPAQQPALDPRVAYLMADLLQEVMRTGTGAGSRARGFVLPAAGKTGTSHDAWFAGFTSELICVVWVGYDDNRELNLEGARAALPIWTEFMKRAHQYREYRNVTWFEPPDGIVTVEVDPETGALAAFGCPKPETMAFIAGTQPIHVCPLHGGSLARATQVAGWDAALPVPADVTQPAPRSTVPVVETRAAARPAASVVAEEAPLPSQSEPPKKQKRGFFRRILDVFK